MSEQEFRASTVIGKSITAEIEEADLLHVYEAVDMEAPEYVRLTMEDVAREEPVSIRMKAEAFEEIAEWFEDTTEDNND